MSFASLHSFNALAVHYLALWAPYLAAAAFVLALLCLAATFATRRRLKRLVLGRNGSIEESIAILAREGKEIKEFRTELEQYLKLVESRLRGSVQGVATVRFNPFVGGQGGNQSFATAFLDEEGSGVVFSTLYARDRVGVYAKPVDKGASSFELTQEEKDAIAEATESIASHKK
jgi:hypothetical protein